MDEIEGNFEEVEPLLDQSSEVQTIARYSGVHFDSEKEEDNIQEYTSVFIPFLNTPDGEERVTSFLSRNT